MRVAVLSDTHIQAGQVDHVMSRLLKHLQGVDQILHAGDIVCAELLDALGSIAPVQAVIGNMDSEELRGRLPEQHVLRLAGHAIGLIHGWGAPGDLPRKVVERFIGSSGKSEVEVVVFGHSHQPLNEKRHGVLLLNPGSPTDRHFAPYHSMAYLDLGAEVHSEIIVV
jgi:putative phosphoesterase